MKHKYLTQRREERRVSRSGYLSLLCGLCVLCVSAFIPSAHAATNKITASITITNLTVNGLAFTVNGDTRTFTNNVVTSAGQVFTNSDVTGNGSKTNLLNQIRATPFAQVTSSDTGSNTFNLVGNGNLPMAVSVSGTYASISYSTQLVDLLIGVQVPVSALPTAFARTNVASGIAGALNNVENTNPVHQISLAASELMGLTNSQLVSGIKFFTNSAGQFFGIISNSPAISGTVILLVGGLYTSPILASPISTNGVNVGNAFSSPGVGINSEQFGASASALAVVSTAIGNNAVAQLFASTAVGAQASANGTNTTSVGYQTESDGTASSSFGYQAVAAADRATALGYRAFAPFTNSTAVGASATTTAPNQVMLGASGISTVVQNDLTVQGAMTVLGGIQSAPFAGTNNFLANSDIAFTRKAVSSLANGNNAAVPIGTNMFIEVSGPSGAFTINGIANGRDGKFIIIVNQTGQNMTIAHDSGTDPTAANRIISMTGADRVTTGNGAATLIYSGAAARWLLISFDP